MGLDDYHHALDMLESSLDQLKLNIQPNNPASLSLNHAELERLVPATASSHLLDSQPNIFDEGPTPIDAEMEIQQSTALLDTVEDLAEDASFYGTLSRHLQRLLGAEKKSKSPNAKMLLDLTVLSDYNVLRESLRQQGCSTPSSTASQDIARCKAAGSPGGILKTKGDWYARRLRAKAAHLVRLGELPSSGQGKGATHHSLLCNEDMRQGILAYLRSLQVGQVSACTPLPTQITMLN
jgi:hypothetical protein